MSGKLILAAIVAFGVSLGILYLVDTYAYKVTSDIIQNALKVVIVLIVVGIAGWITSKIGLHNPGIGIEVAGIKN